MRFLRPPGTPIDKSRTTLCSVSSSTMVSGNGGGSSNRTQTTATSSSSDSNNNLDDEDDGIESLNRSMNGCGGSGGSGGSDERDTTCSLDDGEHDDDDNGSYNECDITLIDDDDILCDAKTDGEMLYCQVVELLRFELEVCCNIHCAQICKYFKVNGKKHGVILIQ